MIDHLFRHHYGKMVSILTSIFGLTNLEVIEDAVQDTFIQALSKWRHAIPENPEAWLTKASKNRAIDLLRKIKIETQRYEKLDKSSAQYSLDHFFSEHEIEDSQLRMIFTACHPALNAKDQIAFALKTIAGFSTKEIASALLLKEETVKKRLQRARKTIETKKISFQLPSGKKLKERLERVYEVLYLIFNEGFHSNHQTLLIRKELCGEALRLTKLLLKKEAFRSGTAYALFALMCFHVSRLESRISENFESIDLENQDRTKWYFPLIQLGNNAMLKAVEYPDYSCYHIEAAIAVEHLSARTFEKTNWNKILKLYDELYELQRDAFTRLNQSIVLIQLNRLEEAHDLLRQIEPDQLEQRAYLYYGVMAEYYKKLDCTEKAHHFLEEALNKAHNQAEKNYLIAKKETIQ